MRFVDMLLFVAKITLLGLLIGLGAGLAAYVIFLVIPVLNSNQRTLLIPLFMVLGFILGLVMGLHAVLPELKTKRKSIEKR